MVACHAFLVFFLSGDFFVHQFSLYEVHTICRKSFKNILGGTSGTNMVGLILILHAMDKQATNLYTSVGLTLRRNDWNLYRRIIGRRRLLNDHVSRFPDWLPTAWGGFWAINFHTWGFCETL